MSGHRSPRSARSPPPLRRTRPRSGRSRSRNNRPSSRDPFLDNAKYLTIVLVAIGHVWDPLRDDSRMAGALYLVLYAFHMPAFIIVSGYLSRSFEGKPRQIKRLVTGILVPYVVFQTIYTLFMRWASDNPDREFHYQEPGFALWFLVALFLWRLTTPVWKSMRWPVPRRVGHRRRRECHAEHQRRSEPDAGRRRSCRTSSWVSNCGPSTSRSCSAAQVPDAGPAGLRRCAARRLLGRAQDVQGLVPARQGARRSWAHRAGSAL